MLQNSTAPQNFNYQERTWKLTFKNFFYVNGKLKAKILIKYLNASSQYEAKKKLALHFDLILKCEEYKPKNPTNANRNAQ